MNSIKGMLLTSVSQLSKIITGFVLIKLIALHLGPSGLANVGNLLSVMAVLSILAGGGVVNATLKNIGQHQFSARKIVNFYSSIITYSSIFSFITFVFVFLYFNQVSNFLFGKSDEFFFVTIVLLSQVPIFISNLVIAGINGFGFTGLFSKVQLISNLIALISFLLFFKFLPQDDAVIFCILIMYTSYFLPSIFVIYKFKLKRLISYKKCKISTIKEIYPFSLMAFVGCISFPVVEILVRYLIESNLNAESAGLWLAVMKLSSSYMGFISLFLVFYLVPKISYAKKQYEIFQLIKNNTLILGFVFIFGALIIYYFRIAIISFVLSVDFLEAEGYMKYQLVGDLFKVVSYGIGVLTIAKSYTKTYIFGEILQGVLFLSLTYLTFKFQSSLENVFVAYALSYLLYSIVVVVVFVFFINNKSERC